MSTVPPDNPGDKGGDADVSAGAWPNDGDLDKEFDPVVADAALTGECTPLDVGAALLEAGVLFCVELVRWLLSKGVDPEDIGILAQICGVNQGLVLGVAKELAKEQEVSLVQAYLLAASLTPLIPASPTGQSLAIRLSSGADLPRAFMVGEHAVIVDGDTLVVKKDKTLKPISNFVAIVSEYRLRDDGVATIAEYGIDVLHAGCYQQVYVNAQDFSDLGWLPTHVGPTATIYPRCRETVRAAIQELSRYVHNGPVPRTTVYGHLGWRQLPDGQRVFLTAAGALGGDGIVPGVEVGLPGDFARYYLDGAATDEELRGSVRASLSILDLGPETVTAPILAAPYRAPLGEANLTVFLVGYTGSLKSSLAALAQQHFGSEMDVRHLPASWSSTDNALEALAFVAKDSLLVVDDFNPTGSQSEVSGWHAKAERVIRAVGNGSGRSRLSADSELQTTRPARCLLLATGEDRPRGQSLRARYLSVDVERGQIDLSKLTIAQEDAVSGSYGRAMAGYLRWIARNWENVDRSRKEHTAQLTTDLHDIDAHPFTKTIVAELGTGFRTFLDFAVDIGAVTQAESEALWTRAWPALRELLRRQQEGQREANPVDKFFRFLTSAISSGHAHISSSYGGVPIRGQDLESYGWRQRPERMIYGHGGVVDKEEGEWMSVGDCVGWLHIDHLYLDPTAAMGVAEAQAHRMGESLAVSESTLGKRMNERGLLTVEESRDTLKTRKTIQRQRRSVWDLPRSVLGHGVGEDDPDPVDDAPRPAPADNSGQET